MNDPNTPGTAAGKTVSVVMATYNGARYIREQLDSIIRQTYPIMELLIQDDGSTDATPDICRAYAQRFPFIKFTVNASNLGYNRNFRSLAMQAKGDFVAFSDQDDVWFEDKIAKQVAAIGDCDICFSDHLRGPDLAHSHRVSYKNCLERQLFLGIVGHSMLLCRDFVQQESNWLDYIFFDWGLALHAHLGNGLAKVSEPLNLHRDHSGSVTAMQHSRYYTESKRKTTYQPFLHGLSNYRKLQEKPAWKLLYSHLYEATGAPRFTLAHRLCHLLLRKDPLSLLRLCFLCMRHRDRIYPSEDTRGIRGMIRGWSFPFIFAYHCTLFNFEVG